MAVTSNTEIMNSALRKLGAERIVSENDDNDRARTMKDAYTIVRDRVLRSHPWNFAIAYFDLAVVDPTPSNVFDYSYVFQLPSDCLRVLKTNLNSLEEWEEIEGRRIATDASELKVKAIKKITDVTKFDDNFVEALAWALAEDCAYALTQSTAQVENARKAYKETLAEARSFDAQVGSVRRVESDEWLTARRY